MQISQLLAMKQGSNFRRLRSRLAAGLRWLADRADAVDTAWHSPGHALAFGVLAQPPMPANPTEIKRNAAVSTAVTRCQAEYDDYVEYFLDWCIEEGYTGDYDGDQVIALTRRFDVFADMPPVHTCPFFQALRRAGVMPRMIDLPHTDPRHAEKKAAGCQRPRVRVYDLPTEMADYFVPTIDAETLKVAA